MWRYFFWEENRNWRWRFCLLGLTFIIFAIGLKPLKGDIITYDYSVTYYFIAFSIISVDFLLFVFLFPKLFKKYFSFENWTYKRFVIWFLSFVFTVSFTSFLFDFYYLNPNDFVSWGSKYYVNYQIPIVIFVAMFLLLFFVVFDPNPAKGNFQEINKSSNLLELKTTQGFVERKILEVKDTNNRVELNIFLNELYFFKASDNYVEIFYKNTEGVTRVVIRNTLKDIENQFSDIPQLFRCHKAFVVNTEKVKEVIGNAKGYYLTLADVEEKIPVSRSNIEAMKKCLPTFFEQPFPV